MNQRTKIKRTLENAGMLEQKYNKALVCAQLKAIFSYDKETDVYADQDKIMEAWQATSKVVTDRPRFFNIRDVFKLDQDVLVLTSSFSTFWQDNHEYIIFTQNYKGFVNFGIPVVKNIIDLIGGPNYICRVIAYDGVVGLIKILEEAFIQAKDYVDKDRISSNIKTLKQFKG